MNCERSHLPFHMLNLFFFFFEQDALNVLPLFTLTVTESYDYSRPTSMVTVKELTPTKKVKPSFSLFGLCARHPEETIYNIPDLHGWIC